VQTATTDGLMVDAALVLPRMKSWADWDTHFARRSEISVWSTGGKNLA
jgi:hypothetical protein